MRATSARIASITLGMAALLLVTYVVARAETGSDYLGVAYHNSCDWNGATAYDTSGGPGVYSWSTTNTSSWPSCPYEIMTEHWLWTGGTHYANYGSTYWQDPAPQAGEVANAQATTNSNRIYTYHRIKHPSYSTSATRCPSFNVGPC